MPTLAINSIFQTMDLTITAGVGRANARRRFLLSWQNRFDRFQLKAGESADRNLSGPFAIDSPHGGETI